MSRGSCIVTLSPGRRIATAGAAVGSTREARRRKHNSPFIDPLQTGICTQLPDALIGVAGLGEDPVARGPDALLVLNCGAQLVGDALAGALGCGALGELAGERCDVVLEGLEPCGSDTALGSHHRLGPTCQSCSQWMIGETSTTHSNSATAA